MGGGGDGIRFFTRDSKKRPITAKLGAAGDSIRENSSRLIKLVSMSEKAKLERAKAADLITLPAEIQGTNCGNCRYFVKLPGQGRGNCIHPKLLQVVNANQCCAFWDHTKVERPWKKR